MPNSTNKKRTLDASLRWKVRWKYLTPCQKWQEKRTKPVKLVFHILKIILVTTQVLLFGVSRISTVEFFERSTTTFRHLYLKDWDVSYEALPYPPPGGPFAVYDKESFHDSILFALDMYNRTQEKTLGSFSYYGHDGNRLPIKICKNVFADALIHPWNETYVFDSTIEKECINISRHDNSTNEAQDFLTEIDTQKLEVLTLEFQLKAIHLQRWKALENPECVKFHLKITYDNRGHDGQILISLTNKMQHLACSDSCVLKRSPSVFVAALIGLSFFRIVLLASCMLSTVLCLRSIFKAQMLKTIICNHLKTFYSIQLTFGDKMEFLNMWFITVIISDVFIIVGTCLEIAIEQSALLWYDTASYFLGTGALIAWFSVLRYLGYFEKYNMLILSMKKAVPNILRFLVCAGVLFFGYTFTGWVVFGPQHLKFRTISATCENLFAMLNGDELFVTFSVISDTSSFFWFYSRVYLYSFNCLFIYFILNLFIAVITDSYETVKHCKLHGFPRSVIERFAYGDIPEHDDTLNVQYEEKETSFHCGMALCCQKKHEDGSYLFF